MKKILSSVGVLLQLLLPSAHASVVLSGTRFIFPENQDGISFRVINRDNKDYLVLTKILNSSPAGGAGDIPKQGNTVGTVFMATPPIFQLRAKHENIVRLTKVGGILPVDRESLFWLSVASIPSSERGAQGNTLQIAVRNNMKLFYRPSGLKISAVDAYKKLTFKHNAQLIKISNPTPYYITLANVTVAGKNVDDAPMLAPFSSQLLDGCHSQNQCLIQWQTINDYGALTPQQSIDIK